MKIASKALTLRLEKVLPELISVDQCAYVKERNIFDAVRTIGDIMDYTKLRNIPGLIVTIDFEKAFDSLSWSFFYLRSWKSLILDSPSLTGYAFFYTNRIELHYE